MSDTTMSLGELIKSLAQAYSKFGNVPVVISQDVGGADVLQYVAVGYIDGTQQKFCILSSYVAGVCQGCPRCKKGLPH